MSFLNCYCVTDYLAYKSVFDCDVATATGKHLKRKERRNQNLSLKNEGYYVICRL